MKHRTIGIDLAIRGDHVAQIYDDGRPAWRPIRYRGLRRMLTAHLNRHGVKMIRKAGTDTPTADRVVARQSASSPKFHAT